MTPSAYSIDKSGWLDIAIRKVSPNFDVRPDPEDITLLVIHNISLPPGEFGGGYVQDFFLNHLDAKQDPYFLTIEHLQVSAHFFIERTGGIFQFVSCLDRAWHAGQSVFEGRTRCNDFSIGIELEGTDEQAYTAKQYNELQKLSCALIRRFPGLSTERIVGHEHISPGRKTDPGPAFNWTGFKRGLVDTSGCDTL